MERQARRLAEDKEVDVPFHNICTGRGHGLRAKIRKRMDTDTDMKKNKITDTNTDTKKRDR